jgi:hypothetical protein
MDRRLVDRDASPPPLEMRGERAHHLLRLAFEADVGDPHHLDPFLQQVVRAFAVGLEGAARAVGGEDVELDAEAGPVKRSSFVAHRATNDERRAVLPRAVSR